MGILTTFMVSTSFIYITAGSFIAYRALLDTSFQKQIFIISHKMLLEDHCLKNKYKSERFHFLYICMYDYNDLFLYD